MMDRFLRALATSVQSRRAIYFLFILLLGSLIWFVPINTATTFPTNSAQQSGDIRPLAIGAPIERELAGGQAHSYQIALETSQYCRVIVKQQGIDVVIILRGPDGKELYQMDSPTGDKGEETLPWVTKDAGQYQVIVRSFDEKAKAGRYEIRLAESRQATPQDESLSAGERASIEGERLFSKQTAETSRQALKLFEEAVKSFHDAGDRKREAEALNSLAFAHHSLSEVKQALEALNQALPLYREVGERAGEARVLNNIGAMYFNLGEYRKGVEYLQQALPIQRELNIVDEEANTLRNIGGVYYELGEYQSALDYVDRVLALIRNSGMQTPEVRAVEASALLSICNATTRLGAMQRALDTCQQAVSIFRQLDLRIQEGGALNRTALVLYYLGESEKALEHNHESLRLLRQTGNRRQQAITLNDIGLIYYGRGDYAKAIEYYEQSLPLAKEVDNRLGQAVTLHNLGVSYSLLGVKDKALDCFNQALALARAIDSREAEAKTLASLGRWYQLSGDNRKAIDYYQQALQLCRAIKVSPQEAQALLYLAQANRELGHLAEALAQSEEALRITESLRTRVVSPELRSSFFASVQDRYDFYVDALMQAHEQRPDEGRAALALQASERARARSLLELLAEARADIRQGVDPALLQKERALQQQLNSKAAAQTRLLSGKYTEAQAAAMAKVIADLTAQLEQVETQIRTASPGYAALTQPQPLTVAEIQKQVLDDDTLLLEYTLGEKRSYLWAVTPTSINSYQLPPRAEIETAARKVYNLLTARQPRPGETEAQLGTRAKAADAEYQTQASALSQTLLGPVATQLGNKRLLIVAPGALQYLPFGALPAPAPGGLGDGGTGGQNSSRSVAQSPRRPVSPAPLITEHEIVSLPSASALAVLRREMVDRQPAPNLVAVLADPVFSEDDPRLPATAGRSRPSRRTRSAQTPPQAQAPTSSPSASILERAIRGVRGAQSSLPRLVFTREEADAILAAAPARAGLKAVDFRANRSTATGDDLGRYRIVHFATHGLLNSEHPELSGLVLSLVDQTGRPQDGFLRLHEIYNLRLPADLVVLSACQTALGKEIKGEGLVGLTRGFMYAGAPRVVASLWQVNDAATAELMKRFYRRMLREGLRPAAALRAAQIELWKQRQWQAPYYWGAFVLQGEWR
jgi:CHAT domain-containing protein/Tfp pilus assembly protein PilF